MPQENEIEIIPADFSLLLVTNFVLFPVDLRDVRTVLAKNAYQLAPLPYPIPRKPTRVGSGGTIARKEDFAVNMDSDIKSVGIFGMKTDNLIESFNELLELLKTELNVDLTSEVKYYEYIGHFNMVSDKTAINQFGKFFEKLKKFKALEKIIGCPISNFGLRLVPKNTVPNQAEWFDIAFEPEVLTPNKYYYGCIFRSLDYDRVCNWINNEEDFLEKSLEVINSE